MGIIFQNKVIYKKYCDSMRAFFKFEFLGKLFGFLLLLILFLNYLLIFHYNVAIILFEFLFPSFTHLTTNPFVVQQIPIIAT